MDPFSQAGLGAVVAQAVGHRRLGFKAALIGAGAGALPDIDVLFSIGGDFVDQLITHRGITHSLFFAPVVGPMLGWLVWYVERRKLPDSGSDRRNLWMLVVTLALLSHPLLDLLTPYGTQLLLPFADTRFAINAMPIIDPIYTLLLGAGLFVAWRLARSRKLSASTTATLTLVISSAYLGYGWLQGARAEAAALTQLASQGIVPERIAAFPTLLQVHLRRVVARTLDSDRIGFYSTWAPCEIAWSVAPRTSRSDYAPFLNTREGRVFDWFAMGWAHFRLQPSQGGIRLTVSDLRYGFNDDPLESVFSLSAMLEGRRVAAGSIRVGRSLPGDSERAMERLVTDTYAPACRLFSGGRIPPTPNVEAGPVPAET